MPLEMFIIGLGIVAPEMHPPALCTLLGTLSHKLADRKHILTLPSERTVKDLIHNVSLPETDYLNSLTEWLLLPRDTDISPH